MAPSANKLAWVRKTPGGSASAKSNVKTFDFGDDEGMNIVVPVATGHAGDTGEQQIKDQFAEMQTAIGDYWTNYRDGIALFQNKMSFSSEEKAEAQVLNAVFDVVAKKALGAALDAATSALEAVPGAGEAIKFGVEVAEAVQKENERAAAAKGDVELVKYLNDLISGIKAKRDASRKAIQDKMDPLLKIYVDQAKKDKAQGGGDSGGRVVGDAAAVVNAVKAWVKAFEAKSPTAKYFQEQFSRTYADTPGLTDLISHGGREAGKLYYRLYLDLEIDENGSKQWGIKDRTSPAWKLVTKRKDPDRLAESLLEGLDGGKPWQIDLEKKVFIQVEMLGSGILMNDWKEGWIFFDNNPGQYRMSPLSIEPKLLKAAWDDPEIRAHALNTVKITGDNE